MAVKTIFERKESPSDITQFDDYDKSMLRNVDILDVNSLFENEIVINNNSIVRKSNGVMHRLIIQDKNLTWEKLEKR